MSIVKRVWRLNSNSYWLVGEHESWFAHMASKGYQLVKLNRVFSTFEKREPVEMRYRIELANGTTLSLEQIELYEEAGWDYVESSKYYHVFASPKEQQALEIYTDPTEQAITVEHLKKQSKRNLNIVATALVFITLLAMLSLFGNDPFLYWLVNGGALGSLMIVMVYIGNVVMMLKGYRGMKKLATQLERGEQIDHEAPWRMKFMKDRFWNVFLFVILIGFVYIPFKSLNEMETITIPATTSDIPVLRLDKLLDGQFVKDEPFFIDDVDWGNHLSKEWSALTPVRYGTIQSGYAMKDGVNNKDLEESLTIEYYELRLDWLANLYIQSTKKYWSEIIEPNTFELIEHDFFEQLYLNDNGYSKRILAQWDEKVVEIGYSGQLTAEELIEKAESFYRQF